MPNALGAIGAPWWTGRPVWIIGGGASARGLPLDDLKDSGGTVVAINDSALALPWAHALVSVDRHWMGRRQNFLRSFAGEVILGVTGVEADDYPADMPGTLVRVSQRGEPLSMAPTLIKSAGHSGHAGINVALLKRAHLIFLVGFDMKLADDGADHWHGGYAWSGAMNHGHYPRRAKEMDKLAVAMQKIGARAFNLNPESAITAFPFLTFGEALALCSTSPSSSSPADGTPAIG